MTYMNNGSSHFATVLMMKAIYNTVQNYSYLIVG